MQQQREYVGIDLHRRRSVIVRMSEGGEVLECVRIVNDPVALSLELAKAGPDPEVALEATYGWYWAADLLQADGANVHLVHPLGLHWDARRVKNDERDATELAHRLRRDDLPESLDRAGGGAGAARAHPLPGEAGGVAHLGQSPDPRGDGQARDPADPQ
jgi:transposase